MIAFRHLITLASIFVAAGAAYAKGSDERWSPYSRTATSITGPILLSKTRLQAAKVEYPLRIAADLQNFSADEGMVSAQVFAVKSPKNPVLLNGNRLCNGPVRWMAVWRKGPNMLVMAAFAGRQMPTSIGASGICGTFYYERPSS
jgi:hypothetical protein